MKKTRCLCLCFWGIALAGPVALPSPAAAQNREHQQLAADARVLQEQTQQLAISIAQLTQTLAEAVKALNARLDDANNASRKGFADQKLLIDNMANDVRVVRERTDDTNLRIATLREELEAMRGQMLALQQAAVAPPPPPVDPNAPIDPNAPVPTVGPVTPPPLPSTLGLSPTRMLETARSDYFSGQYALAITGFEQFLKAFPRSESAGEAQYYIGESYFSQNRWPEAIAAYNAVIQNYAMSSFVPEAYYKLGNAHERAGEIDAARTAWEAVVKAYPDSDGGRLAKQRLDGLSRQPRQSP
jgi:tol-pal system protein YbgF